MGRSPKPIRILCTTENIAQSRQVQALAAKGHVVTWNQPDADLVLGPEACAMDETLLPYVDLAVRRTWERLGLNKKGGSDGEGETESVPKASRSSRKGTTAETRSGTQGEEVEGADGAG